MKPPLLSMLLLSITLSSNAQIADPIDYFRSNIGTSEPIPFMKWEADLNGDGKNEVMLRIKSEYDEELKDESPTGWFVYLSGPEGYTESKGMQNAGESDLDARVMPRINLTACYIGPIEELGNKHGLITEQIETPKVGDPVATIRAYTVEGDHLHRTKLAEYNPLQPNALFDKYLKDGKRTVITPVEVTK